MEAISLSLAVLPLVINQLDNYVKGLQTLKLFRTKHYRRHLETLVSDLGAHEATLLNTVSLALGTKYASEFRDLLSQSEGKFLNRPIFDRILRDRTGPSYDAIATLMGRSSKLLQELSKRLDTDASDSSTIPWGNSFVVFREYLKIKHIVSKSICDDLFKDLRRANKLLINITNQAIKIQELRHCLCPELSVSRHRNARKIAKSFHRSLICDECWKCLCQNKHHIRLILNSAVNSIVNEESCKIIIATEIPDGPTQTSYSWEEMEVKSTSLPSQTPAQAPEENDNVEFGIPVPISNMCSTLRGLDIMDGQRELVGFLPDTEYQHYMYLVTKSQGCLQSQTMEELISLLPSYPFGAPTGSGLVLDRKNRLNLAAELASIVIRFYGSWLPINWSSRDIIFPKGPTGLDKLHRPFLMWNISNHLKGKTGHTQSPVFGNKPLLRLGLILIELSLSQPMEVLQIPMDKSSDKEEELLNTADRCLDDVYVSSGMRYGSVVQKCLSLSRTSMANLDDDNFQVSFLEYIVLPLVEDVKSFNGLQ